MTVKLQREGEGEVVQNMAKVPKVYFPKFIFVYHTTLPWFAYITNQYI